MKTRCTETLLLWRRNQSGPSVRSLPYLHCCVWFSTSSGCLKSGAFFFWAGGFETWTPPRPTCLIVVSYFLFVPFSPHIAFVVELTLTCQSSVIHVRCHCVNPSLCFWLRSLWDCNIWNQSWQEKKEEKNTFLLWMFCFLFFLPLRSVTSFVFHSSHTRFEHHLYVALYLCNSCSCDYDGLRI